MCLFGTIAVTLMKQRGENSLDCRRKILVFWKGSFLNSVLDMLVRENGTLDIQGTFVPFSSLGKKAHLKYIKFLNMSLNLNLKFK